MIFMAGGGKKFWLSIPLAFLLLAVIAVIAISGCVGGGEKESSSGVGKVVGHCETNREDVKCSGSYSNGEITLSLSPTIAGAYLGGAYLSTCEITGSLWSCSGRAECEVISSQNPFKVKCPVSSGAYAAVFKLKRIIEQGQELTEPYIANCASTPDGKFDCELIVEPKYYFKV